MLDGVSLDQLRAFIAAADAGSFSAAARTLRRAQSVVSQTISSLEAQLRVPLFDRSGRYPTLTGQGRQMLADARAIATGIDQLKARAKGMADGLEHELSVVIDVMFPMVVLTHAVAQFSDVFPTTPLRLYVEALGGVAAAVLDRNCGLGVMGSLAVETPELVAERLIGVQMVMVAAATHPLAAVPGPVPLAELARHIQLVLTDRTDLSKGKQFGVLSPRVWRLADLGAKHEFLRAGLGWDESPITDAYRDTGVPDKDRYMIGIGAGYKFSDSQSLDVGYAHYFAAGHATMNSSVNNTDPITGVVLQGRYNNALDYLALTYRFGF